MREMSRQESQTSSATTELTVKCPIEGNLARISQYGWNGHSDEEVMRELKIS